MHRRRLDLGLIGTNSGFEDPDIWISGYPDSDPHRHTDTHRVAHTQRYGGCGSGIIASGPSLGRSIVFYLWVGNDAATIL